MSNQHFKFNTGSTINDTTQKGNIAIAQGGSKDWGPTSLTGFYPEIAPPASGYTIYYMRTTGEPSIHVAYSDSQAISFLKSFGSTGSTISDMLLWASNQPNYYVQTGSTTNATPTPTPVPTDTPTPTPAPTNTPTPTPTTTSTYFYGTTAELAYGMTNGLSSVSFNTGSDLCVASTMNATQFSSLNYGDTIYIYDSINGGIRQGSSAGYGSTSINFMVGCTYQYGRYRVATSQNDVCSSYTGFTDANFYGSDITSSSYFGSNQLTGLTAGTYYLYDTVTTNERQFTNSYSNNTLFNFSGSYTTNPCTGATPTPTPTPARSGYYVASTYSDAVTGGTQLTNVNLYGSTFCVGMSGINADQFASLSGTFYVYSVSDNQYRQISSFNSSLASFSGSCVTPSGATPTPTPSGRSGYYVASTYGDAMTGGTQLTNVNLYTYTFCQGNAGMGSDQFSSMSGLFYVYSVTDNQYRQISLSGGSSLASFSGPCV